ncbi:MAG: hypothetical protein H7039_10510 [Bryobacteraceae bacterium]|nr:hypothetical protein [Bryobacteraceae bacterium]
MQPPPDPKDPQKSRPPLPEMLGATNHPFEIGPGTTEIQLTLQAPGGPARSTTESKPAEVTLRVENITGEKVAPSFIVYLNVPQGETPTKYPELMAGTVGLFGLVESSHPDSMNGGAGLSFKFNITEVYGVLIASKRWDPRNLKISLVPTFWDVPVPRVRVGRISLYFQ